MSMNTRQPDCAACPLNTQRKVWGDGPMTASILLVGEMPGPSDEQAGKPFMGWAGARVNTMLRKSRVAREDCRVENVAQCRGNVANAAGKKAVACCGPSLRAIIAAMPNLRLVVAFGDIALRELSEFRESKARVVAYATDAKKQARARVKFEKARDQFTAVCAKWEARVAKARLKPSLKTSIKLLAAAAPQAPVPPVPLATDVPQVRGYSSVTKMRGSPLLLNLDQQPGAPVIYYLPVIHPVVTHANRQPRLWPVCIMDMQKAARLARGEQVIPAIRWRKLTTAEEISMFFARARGLPGAAPAWLSLDIEWSRKQQVLACIGIGGPGDEYAIIPCNTREENGVMNTGKWPAIRVALQAGFSDPLLAWGGHYIAYDKGKLGSLGLQLPTQWCSLYGFHLCYSELGSPRDEESAHDDFSQATGYDLGFVSSLLTALPYHKGVVTHVIDALDVDTQDLFTYCIGDVARAYHAWLAEYAELCRRFIDPAVGLTLLRRKMRCAEIAAEMTRIGLPIREDVRRARLKDWQAKRDAALSSAPFNLRSTAQLADALVAAGVKGIRWNQKTGKPQLSGNVVATLLERYPDQPLLRLRQQVAEAQKEAEHYEQLEPGRDGRAHPRWKVHGTSGSRWSSTPNLQNQTQEQREVIG